MNMRSFYNQMSWHNILLASLIVWVALSNALVCFCVCREANKKMENAERLDNAVRKLYVEQGLYTEKEKQERMHKAMMTIMDRDVEIMDLRKENDELRTRIAQLEDQNLTLRLQVAPVVKQ